MHPRDQTIFALSSGRPPERDFDGAAIRASGRDGADRIGRQGSAAAVGDAGVAARRERATDRRCGDPLVPRPGQCDRRGCCRIPRPWRAGGLAALFSALSGFENVRAAEPGEFTRRAFENGKLDLTEAEALDDLIHADTDRQRRQALRQLKGMLGERARHWRAQIIDASALIEAGIDFSDEGDVSAELVAPALAKIRALLEEIEEVLAAQGQSERLREGLVVAIAGAPNVGKSTLMNQLARREVAIVSPHAGTTRDVIEVQLDLDGYPVTVIDTAGIRETDDPVEQEGVRRARARAAEADLVLWLDDGDSAAAAIGGAVPVWTVRTKIDLEPRSG